MKVEQEEGGLVAGTLKGLDLVENASDTESRRRPLAEELVDFPPNMPNSPWKLTLQTVVTTFRRLSGQLADSVDEVMELID